MNRMVELANDIESNPHSPDFSSKISELAVLVREYSWDKKLFFKLAETDMLNINDKFTFGWKEDKYGWVAVGNIVYDFEEARMTDFIEWFNSWGIA